MSNSSPACLKVQIPGIHCCRRISHLAFGFHSSLPLRCAVFGRHAGVAKRVIVVSEARASSALTAALVEELKSLISAKHRDAREAVVFSLEVLSQGLKFSGGGRVLGLWISTEAGG